MSILQDKLDEQKLSALSLNLNNLDDVEIGLIDFAHTVATYGDDAQACMGRCLKTFAPTWIAFMKSERERDEPHGPGRAMFSIVRVFALLAGMMISSSAKSKVHGHKCVEPVSKLFLHDLEAIVTGKCEETDDGNGKEANAEWH